MATIRINNPSIIKITNTSNVAKSFVPYRENFMAIVAAGKSIEFLAGNAGQALYYLAQATEGLTVTQVAGWDNASDNIKIIRVPAEVTIKNISNKIVSFQPYKENFVTNVPANDSVVLTATTVGQVLYYAGQAVKDMISIEDVAVKPVSSFTITATETNGQAPDGTTNPTTITVDGTAVCRYVAKSSKTLPMTVSVTNATGNWSIEGNVGTLVLTEPTGNVTFTI